MTYDKQALIDLRDAVVSVEDDMSCSQFLLVLGRSALNAIDAYNGSLDAALSLLGKVLSGINQYSIVTDPTCGKATACWWPDGLSGDRECYGESWFEGDTAARALLIAILNALIEGCE